MKLTKMMLQGRKSKTQLEDSQMEQKHEKKYKDSTKDAKTGLFNKNTEIN